MFPSHVIFARVVGFDHGGLVTSWCLRKHTIEDLGNFIFGCMHNGWAYRPLSINTEQYLLPPMVVILLMSNRSKLMLGPWLSDQSMRMAPDCE